MRALLCYGHVWGIIQLNTIEALKEFSGVSNSILSLLNCKSDQLKKYLTVLFVILVAWSIIRIYALNLFYVNLL